MIAFPSQTLLGATNGLLLWFQIIIPTLLPTLIISNVLILSNAIPYITIYIGPVFQKLFSLSPNGSFAALSGFLCGYPVGAKVTADLVKNKQISLKEGNYLLSFCNNTSPNFISSYIISQQFGATSLLIPSLGILYVANYICSLLFRKCYGITKIHTKYDRKKLCFHFEIFDRAIMNAFETITKIGGYLILFSVLFQWTKLPILEITTGIPFLISNTSSFIYSYVSVMCLTSFGGLCSIAQTSSVLHGSGLSILFYTIEKLITALVTSLFAFLYVTIILR